MRIRLVLSALTPQARLPLNYNYFLASLIYRLLRCSSHDYSTFLHDEGYRAGAKRFKLFTYSQLLFERFRLEPPHVVALSPRVEWQISSPVEEFVEHLARGLLQEGELVIAGVPFHVEWVETLPRPEFQGQMKFTCLSPIVVSRPVDCGGKLRAHYYRYDEPGLSEAVRANLLEKFRLIHGHLPATSDLTITFDGSYIRRKKGKVYKLIDFKGTKIKGILAPFTAKGSPELMEVGYEAGFGEKNSMGFGMVEVVSSGTSEER